MLALLRPGSRLDWLNADKVKSGVGGRVGLLLTLHAKYLSGFLTPFSTPTISFLYHYSHFSTTAVPALSTLT